MSMDADKNNHEKNPEVHVENGGEENEEYMEGEEYQKIENLPENKCDSLHLLQRKTESFRCLQQVLLSHSSCRRNKDFLFPPLQDPGINEAYYYMEPEPVYDDVGSEKYLNLCKELEIVPISRIVRSLPEDTLNLKYYGLTLKQMHALTETLKINVHVKKLILQDNWFNQDVTEMLSNMLEENSNIRVLNLRECRIGEEGAEKLNEALSISQFLTELDLSFNSLGDKGLLNLRIGLCEASNLKVLNLSHNNLTEESADTLEKILMENKVIQELDLSWNLFCTGPGNKKLFNGIKHNDNLRRLHIAWNGISQKPAVIPIVNYLKKSENLEYLDISNNRIEGGTLRAIRGGFLKNYSLKSVKIGNNFFSPDEAYLLATILPIKQNDPLQHLDMENMVFEKKVLPLLAKIKSANKTIKFGHILGNYTIKGPDINQLVFQRCRFLLQKPKKQKMKKDFGHFVLALPDEDITKEQFSDLLKKKKVKRLDQDLINELCNRFMTKKQTVDCRGMKKIYMGYYPDTVLPPPPPKKAKKEKKGKEKGKGKGKQTTDEDAQTEQRSQDTIAISVLTEAGTIISTDDKKASMEHTQNNTSISADKPIEENDKNVST